MGLFGPSEQEIAWKRFAAEVGGTFQGSVLVYVDPWTITLDTYSSSDDFFDWWPDTHMSAAYVSDDGFEFEITAQNFFIKLLQLLNMQVRIQDFEVGYPECDRKFVVFTNKKSKAQALFGNPNIDN